jgi:tetratricopeptide (TPR) repeat protein
VRIFVIPCFWLVLAASGTQSASGEVIRLKNGDVIYADQAKESGNNVTYEIGDNSFTIPKSRVESIENGPRPTQNIPNIADLPTLTPDSRLSGEEQLLDKIVRDHEIDRGALAAVESRGNANEIALAYYIAARAEFQTGKYNDSRRDFETALRSAPQNPALLNYYAALLVRTGNPVDGISYAERAARLAPDSADAFAVLGYAQFAADRPRDAIQSWKKSLALRPDASIQELLARAEREASAENRFSERETGHFVLHYEGGQSSDAFRGQLIEVLESHYQDLRRQFGMEPRSSVQVILYTNQAFFDVTRAPSWTSALNDGKLRIPVDGLSAVTPELARVLRHELTHSFVNQLTMGRCPQWLNEGVAQLMEPQTLGSRIPRLAELFKLEREIPLNELETSFTSFNSVEAALAYDESLAVVEYLRNTYGMPDLLRVLQRIGQGESAEAALRATIHSDYQRLEDEVRVYLVRQAGS